jgi:hypothetical protein
MSSDDELSTHQGYALAFRLAMEWLESAIDTNFLDLVTLVVDMRIDEEGRSHDPAMLSDWAERWGPRTTLTSREALFVVARFVEFERGWSDQTVTKQFIEELRETGEEVRASRVWRIWCQALPEVLSSAEPLQLTSRWIEASPQWKIETSNPD